MKRRVHEIKIKENDKKDDFHDNEEKYKAEKR